MKPSGTALLCDVRDSVLLLIDIQTRLARAMPAKVLGRLQRNTGRLLKSAAVLRVPVFASEQYPQGLGGIEPEILNLLPEDTQRYEKTGFSLAHAGGFLADLATAGRRQAILAGMEAHICVLQTALALLHEGFQVFIVADAVCSRRRESYETALERLRHAGAVVCDAESVLFEWLRDARHEQFKSLQSLLR